MDKKTESFIKKLAEKNKALSLEDINDKQIKRNNKERRSLEEKKTLEEDDERARFFNDMRRRDF